METFAIRHKPTGRFMPVPTGTRGRGASHWDPLIEVNDVVQLPRLFVNKRSASTSLTQWLRGRHEADFDFVSDDGFGGFGNAVQVQVGTCITPDATRKRDNMEIVTFKLVEQHDN